MEDYTRPWTFASESFDFVHLRWLLGSVPDWEFLFRETFKALKPGGWVQSFEPSPIYKSDHKDIRGSAIDEWGKFFTKYSKKGPTFLVLEENLQRTAMEAAGFVGIQNCDYKVSSSIGPPPSLLHS